MKYRHHKYVWSKPYGSVNHDWSFVGPLGAINFHVSITEGYSPSCGLEFHHTPLAQYRPDDAPDHINCPLTGGPCWHDGTSLYASETVWPAVKASLANGNHGAIFTYLEGEADRHFAKLKERDI
jgi:hypothetical protein